MYIDESGDTTSIEHGGTKVLVLTGCIIEDKEKRNLEEALRNIKFKFYGDCDVEFKSNYIRYANPSLTTSSPIKLHDQQRYDEMQKDLQQLLISAPVKIVSVVIDKKGYWAQYPSQNPYHAAYIFLTERFQTFLTLKNALGISIIDPREGGVVEKKNIDKELVDVHRRLQWEKRGFWKPCPSVIEKVLFSDSKQTVGIQVADLYCYPIFHLFQYDKIPQEYTWYEKVSAPKLYYHTTVTASIVGPIGPVIDGTGLKFFPDKSKKDFRFYA